MNLTTFFEKFDRFAEAPNSVEKMREIVLRLAVHGKLVPQDASDESADSFLAKLKAQKGNEDGLRIKSKLIQSIARGEAPFELPPGWAWEQLGNIGETNIGLTYSPQDLSDHGIPVLRSSNIQKGKLDFSDLVRVKCKPKQHLMVQPGDLLICARNGSRALVGKVAMIEGLNEPTTFGAFMAIFRSKLNQYLYYFIRSPLFRQMIAEVNTTTINQITQSNLRSTLVPIPPLPEQKRIVSKVNDLMTLCDRLEEQQNEQDTQRATLARASLARFADASTLSNLDFLFEDSFSMESADFRKVILSLAVQGKLVPQDGHDEPAEQLLKRIKSHRTRLLESEALKKTKSCRQFSSEHAPHTIPNTWVWSILGEITDIGTGSTPSRTESTFWRGGSIPWVTSGSTSRSPIIDGDELVTPEAVKVHRLRIYPPGTLLVALYGQGKTRGQVAVLAIPATINQACAAVCTLDGIASMQDYLKLVLEKQYDEMRLLSAGGAQPNLNVQKVKEILVPLPPLAEQGRIVARVNQLMALVSQLGEQLAASRSAASRLLEALVAELTVASGVLPERSSS